MSESASKDLKERLESEIDKGMFSKYKDKLERQLSPDTAELDKSYSADYQQFKEEQAGKFHILFEFMCRKAHKILKVKIKDKDKEKIEPFLRLAHFDTTPEAVFSLTYLLAIIALVLSIIPVVVFGNFILILIGISGMIFFLFYIPGYPKTTFIKWRAQASDQLVLAAMYLVIQMERISNLELAIEFVARHTSPPISMDFMKVLWDVEAKKYTTVSESLEKYIETWRGWNDDFIESVHLIQFSLHQKSDKERRDTLNRSTKVVLAGTHEHMLHYAHNLQGPMQALHMLGIVLPIMALVMLPLIGAFMGGSIEWYHLLIFYNILVPILVYYLGKDMLQKRPAGTSGIDSYTYMRQKYSRPYLKIGKSKVNMPPLILAIMSYLLRESAITKGCLTIILSVSRKK